MRISRKIPDRSTVNSYSLVCHLVFFRGPRSTLRVTILLNFRVLCAPEKFNFIGILSVDFHLDLRLLGDDVSASDGFRLIKVCDGGALSLTLESFKLVVLH